VEISSITQNIAYAIGSHTSLKPAAKVAADSTQSTASTTQATDSTTQPTATSGTRTSTAGTDTVQISSSAKAQAAAALQELTETPSQTAKEAAKGDVVAKRLQAKEAAAAEAKESPKEKAQRA